MANTKQWTKPMIGILDTTHVLDRTMIRDCDTSLCSTRPTFWLAMTQIRLACGPYLIWVIGTNTWWQQEYCFNIEFPNEKNNTCRSCAVPRSREDKGNSFSSSSFTTNTETYRNSWRATGNTKSHQVVQSDFRNNSLLSKTKEDVTSDFLLISFFSASLCCYFAKNESFAAQQHVILSRINIDLNTFWYYCKMKDLLKCHRQAVPN